MLLKKICHIQYFGLRVGNAEWMDGLAISYMGNFFSDQHDCLDLHDNCAGS